jgi:replicative DNA helicase
LLEEFESPYSLEAEQSVLGAILLDGGTISTVIEILPNSDFFYLSAHKIIYSAMIEMFILEEKIDYVTVLGKISKSSETNNQENRKYLLILAQTVPSISNAGNYAKIVRDKSNIRSLISASKEILEEAFKHEEIEYLLDFAEQKIFNIRTNKSNQTLTKINEVLVYTLERIEELRKKGGKITGLSTGLGDLDNTISGLNKTDLILLAARPGMGKTSLALNIAQNVSSKLNERTAVFSLEMSKEQLASRLISSKSSIPNQKMRTGELNSEEYFRLIESAEIFNKSNLYIDDTPGSTVPEMKAKCRRLGNVGLIIIDYLQLMSGTKRSDNRVQEISEITRQLKIMAKELDCPVICLSQLSRASEHRTDHRPILSDLRDSGSIEQDADIVIFLYRKSYYAAPNDPTVDYSECECIIAKNRHGETRSITLHWQGEFTRFSSYSKF